MQQTDDCKAKPWDERTNNVSHRWDGVPPEASHGRSRRRRLLFIAKSVVVFHEVPAVKVPARYTSITIDLADIHPHPHPLQFVRLAAVRVNKTNDTLFTLDASQVTTKSKTKWKTTWKTKKKKPQSLTSCRCRDAFAGTPDARIPWRSCPWLHRCVGGTPRPGPPGRS